MTKQVVYIAGSNYSGSTLLDLLVGGHPRFVGVGEIYRLLLPDGYWLSRSSDPKVPCSCGNVMDKCELWSVVCEQLRKRKFSSIGEKYTMFLDVFEDIYGPDRIPVDSSKSLLCLQILRSMPQVAPKVLHLIRDVRGHALSARKTARRNKEFHAKDLIKCGTSAPRKYLRRTYALAFLRWYRDNLRIKRYLQKEGIATFQFGYDELCLHSGHIIPKMSEFLGVTPVENMYSPKNSHSHCTLGNASRFQTDKRAGLFYNNRWCYETEWLLPAALLWPVMRFNAREVYGNIRGVLWDKK